MSAAPRPRDCPLALLAPLLWVCPVVLAWLGLFLAVIAKEIAHIEAIEKISGCGTGQQGQSSENNYTCVHDGVSL